jgi:tRNA-specific 2-thiouridylase
LEDLAGQVKEVLARIRSSGLLQQATLRVSASGIAVELAHGEDGVSPGQACVFYAADERGERLLGGGWIKSAEGTEIIPDRSRVRQAVAGCEPLAASPR